MNTPTRILIAILCLIAAIGCYVFGAPAGGLFFLALGAALEGAFWVMLLKKRNGHS